MVINILFFIAMLSIAYLVEVNFIKKLKESGNLDSINLYLFNLVPSIFTTIGIFGTFVGIIIGLLNFDVNNITDSIPILLEGLKTAFFTSILGVILSLIYNYRNHSILHQVENKKEVKVSDELSALKELVAILKQFKEGSNKNFTELSNILVGEKDNSLLTQISKLRTNIIDLEKENKNQSNILIKIQNSLGGDAETSLLTQIQKLRTEISDYKNENIKILQKIINTLNDNNEQMKQKFDEFSVLLAKNNTEALVKVMKTATEEFNKQMSAIVERLVQENFQELNNSVARMNQWQQENKEMIKILIDQFNKVADDFVTTSDAIENIIENTSRLTDENSILKKLIEELKKVMIEDNKFQDIINKLNDTIEVFESNTKAYNEATNKLQSWMEKQKNFNDSIDKLFIKLEQVEKIKDINEVFWQNLKKQLNEAIGTIESANRNLNSEVEKINTEFYNRLNNTFKNLDLLIQRIIKNYDNKL
jgi:ABC-type transporter Mla subunit MlaD